LHAADEFSNENCDHSTAEEPGRGRDASDPYVARNDVRAIGRLRRHQ
jgi:hypothetical protein